MRKNWQKPWLAANGKITENMKNHERFVGFIPEKGHFFIKLNSLFNSIDVIFFLTVVLKLNVISKAKGSAYIEMGNTKVIASVFDPREIVNKQTNAK